MSTTGQPPDGGSPPPPAPWMPPHAGTTPNAERYLLEADALRRRQLHAALLHGSSRTWRDRRRIWPAMVAGAVVVAVIVAVFLVIHALQEESERQQQEEQSLSTSATWSERQQDEHGATGLHLTWLAT